MGLYYNDLVASADKDVSYRNFITLVDVSLIEEEESRGLAETGKYKCDNDRIFLLFPRKTRTCVYRRRRRNPEPKLLHGGASTCSSSSRLLLDLNSVPAADDYEPQNPLQCLDSENPQKPRSFKRLRVIFGSKKTEVKNSPNPNSQLTDNTSRKRRSVPDTKPNGGCKKAKMSQSDPLNPNSQSSNTSRKRPSVPDTKPRGGSKKAKLSNNVNPLLSWRGRDPPESILRIMRHLNVTEQEPKLIFERILYITDVKPNQSRLSMPITQVFRNDFLTHEETEILLQDINNNSKIGVDALLLNQHCQMWDVKLKRWEYEGGSWTYSVTCAWNKFVSANRLVKDNGISVWTFRLNGLLCFAVLPLHTMGQCTGYAVPRSLLLRV